MNIDDERDPELDVEQEWEPDRHWLRPYLLILLAVSLMQEKGVSVLEAVKRQQLWFRWLIYLAAIFVVLLTGIYGPGFAASSFIYFQF